MQSRSFLKVQLPIKVQLLNLALEGAPVAPTQPPSDRLLLPADAPFMSSKLLHPSIAS